MHVVADLRLARMALGLMVLTGSAGTAFAQSYEIPTQAEPKMLDENSVDMMTGIAHFSVSDVSIAGLSHTMSSVHNLDGYVNGFSRFGGFDDNFYGGIGFNLQVPNGGPFDYRSSYLVGLGGGEKFLINTDGTLEPSEGGKLTGATAGTIAACGQPGTTSPVMYTRKDGTEMVFDLTKTRAAGGGKNQIKPGGCGVITKITSPDGLITRINYKPLSSGGAGPFLARIQSVTRNDGFQLKYYYGPDQYDASGQLASYGELLSVVAINNAYQACDPMADDCTLTGVWPKATYSWSNADSVLTVTDQANRTTRFTMDPSGRVVGLKPPTSSVDKATFQYCSRGTYYTGVWKTDTTGVACSSVQVFGGSNVPQINITNVHDRVVEVVEEGRVWTYQFPTGNYGPYYLQYRTFRPDGLSSAAISTILGTGALLVFGSPKFTANFENNARNRMTSAAVLGQPLQTYTYDSRNNIISNGITTAGYDVDCMNMKTCNRPNWVKDTAGNQTDLTWDPVHGGILTETGPAVNGIRPQRRYAYVQRYAWFKASSGVMTRSTEPIWKLASMSFCRSTAASGSGCAVTSDEVVTTYDYGPDSGPNNLLLRGTVVTADGISLRTCYSYDRYGNKISQTEPRANLASCS